LKWHKTKMYGTFSLRRHNTKYCRFKIKIKWIYNNLFV
jgi:hypothetical protein